MQIYDYIIVGGGSAGSDPGQPAFRAQQQSGPAVRGRRGYARWPRARGHPGQPFRRRLARSAFLWHRLRVTTEAMPHNDPDAPRPRELRYEQARVLGGGSSINGQLANRGSPHDYDEWEARGATGWRWETVLPYFKKIERDIDFDGPLHGSDGRIPVRRVFPDNWSDYAKAVAEAFKLAGYKYVPDQNGEFQDGYYPLAMSNLYDRRVSAAIGYLGATVSQRDNLTVSTDTQVCELLFDDTTLRRHPRHGGTAGDRISRPRSDPVLRRDPFAGHAAARRHRPGRRICAIWGSRCARSRAGRRATADGPSLHFGRVLPQATARARIRTASARCISACAFRPGSTAHLPATWR